MHNSNNNNSNDNDNNDNNNDNTFELNHMKSRYLVHGLDVLTDMCGGSIFLVKRNHVGSQAFRAPNQGLESSFCYWMAGQRLA